ncbi:MAG TPA: prepilin-type N-terminal cleavage/methylation domain-containing protein [Verrucomicrobiae bacterium]|jgi:prepilin-type N-terminal cleavage/methylation domain-containing protein|nr:prepilin-type N-terminal cleavage/methylation domain-containing protein [Verrucomicrobiae bacterium]
MKTWRNIRCNNFSSKPEEIPRDAAFTLIELLVVIAIIAIIASLLLPVLSQSKETALGVACLNNTKQLGVATEAYCDENHDYFPQVTPWWTVGPYPNKYGIPCGGEWFRTDNVTPNTIAPLLAPYTKNDEIWVCPKRQRGGSYITPGNKLVSGQDPMVTGFLSYGFNEIGVYGGPDLSTGNMTGNTQKFKGANCRHPSEIVSMCDVSGSNDPSKVNGYADACWLDTIWAGQSGILFEANGAPPNNGFNCRVQTAYAKHHNRLSFVYVDGHAADSYPSRITWGQFWGIFDPSVALKTQGGGTYKEYTPISNPKYDSQEWSGLPE